MGIDWETLLDCCDDNLQDAYDDNVNLAWEIVEQQDNKRNF